MVDIIYDTLLDGIKILPFLYLSFLFIEFIEHKISEKSKQAIIKSEKYGPLIGGTLGAFPQCGFSVSATSLYATRIISMGTLVAVYLSTSDEMLPIFIAQGIGFKEIIGIILLKVIIGIFFGFIIDFILRKKQKKLEIKEICDHDHCHCDEKSIFLSSLTHTMKILLFIVITSFILNLGFELLGEEKISSLLMNNSFLTPFISSLIGLIPNCGASVVLTELYINNVLSFGSAMAGLLTAAGVGLLVLFKINKNIKENLIILFIIYFIGVFVGQIINLL